MPKDNVLKIVAELKRLNDEVEALKDESKYWRKKTEIVPLIAIYNHVSGQGKQGLITITKKDGKSLPYGKRDESLMILNDKLLLSTGKGLKELCDINDIARIQLGNYEYDLEKNNVTN